MPASVSIMNGLAGAAYAIITIFIGTWMYRKAVRRWFIPSVEEDEKGLRISSVSTAAMILTCGVLFLFIRGGVTTATEASCWLKNEGIWFDHIYASSFRTDRENLAIFSGFPGQPNMSLMKYPNKAAKLPGLSRHDKGKAILKKTFIEIIKM